MDKTAEREGGPSRLDSLLKTTERMLGARTKENSQKATKCLSKFSSKLK